MVRDGEDAAAVMMEYFKGLDREHFIAIALNTRGGVIGINTVSIGTLDSAQVHPREVLKFALLANASSIIVGHNHPSGDVLPSSEDVVFTKRLAMATEVVGVKLLDSIIVAGESFRRIDFTGG
jgi:DNA repair protein RadC